MTRPDFTEYASYYEKYVSLVGAGHILDALAGCETSALLAGLGEDGGQRRYLPDKWSIAEVVGHMIDTERIMAYRALRISRCDPTPLPGFEQDDFIRNGPYGHCRLAGLVEEFGVVRRSTFFLFRNLGEEAWDRRGMACGYEVSVKGLAYIIAGHELHHLGVLRERYLPVQR